MVAWSRTKEPVDILAPLVESPSVKDEVGALVLAVEGNSDKIPGTGAVSPVLGFDWRTRDDEVEAGMPTEPEEAVF